MKNKEFWVGLIFLCMSGCFVGLFLRYSFENTIYNFKSVYLLMGTMFFYFVYLYIFQKEK